MKGDSHDRMLVLCEGWQDALQTRLDAGDLPIEAIDAMLTVATAAKYRLEGAARTAHALMLSAGAMRSEIAMQLCKQTQSH